MKSKARSTRIRRSRPKRRQMRRRQMRRGIREYAACQYSTNSAPLFPNASVYAFRNFSLAAASQRVIDVGGSYQFYRIKRVTWVVRPAYDTFIGVSPNANGSTVPNLYWRLDKDATYDANTTLETLKASGCKPTRLDDKNIVKSFAPAVLQGVAADPGKPTSGQLVIGTSRISPWLPTNANAYSGAGQTWAPSSVDHNGLLIAVDQDGGVNLSNPCAYISFTVEYEFKKPLEQGGPAQDDTLVSVDLATIAPQYVPPTEEVKLVGE